MLSQICGQVYGTYCTMNSKRTWACPVLGLGIALSAGSWSIVYSLHEGDRKHHVLLPVAGIIVLVVTNVVLLAACISSRRQHVKLVEALLPRGYHNPLSGAGANASASTRMHADTPADMLLNMMGELLEGYMPDMRDVVFIRTALMRNMDIYRPLDMKGHIKGANLDAEVAQSLMNQLGGGAGDSLPQGSPLSFSGSGGTQHTGPCSQAQSTQSNGGGGGTGGSGAVGAVGRFLAHAAPTRSLLGRPCPQPPLQQQPSANGLARSHSHNGSMGHSFLRHSEPVGAGAESLSSALALILTPQPTCWQEAPLGPGEIGDTPFSPAAAVAAAALAAAAATPSREREPRAAAAALAASTAPAPVAPASLIERAAGFLLSKDRSRSRRASVELPSLLHRNESQRGSAEIVSLAALHGPSSRRSLGGLGGGGGSTAHLSGSNAEPPRLVTAEIRTGARRSSGTYHCTGDIDVPLDECMVTTGVADTDCATGGGGGSASPHAGGSSTAEWSMPRRLTAVLSMFARRGTGSPGSPVRMDGLDNSAIMGSFTGGRMAVTARSSSYQATQQGAAAPGLELLQHMPQSRLGPGATAPPVLRSGSARYGAAAVAGAAAAVAADGPAAPAPSSAALAALRRSMPPPLAVIEEVERLLAGADSWQFDTWALQEASQGHALSCLGFYLMQRAGLVKRFRLNPSKLARLLRQVEAGYLDNPYHNSVHAADVLQTLHVLLHAAQLHVHYLDQLGLLAAYYAAIVHDYGHPGLTSDFLVATSDPLAIRYNDRSPLENHHCAASFALLRRPELDAFAPLSAPERASLRRQVIELVLATDMKQHFSIISHFNTVHRLTSYSQQQLQQQQQQAPAASAPLSRASPSRSNKRALRRSMSHVLSGNLETKLAATYASCWAGNAAPRPVDETERLLSLQVALKCADVGHLGEALDVHQRWLGALEEEFFRQGDRERELGLPISPLFDRAKQGVSKSQVGFYDFVALPLVHALGSAFPGAQPLVHCFLGNYNHWRVVDGQPPLELPRRAAAGRESGEETRTVSSPVGLGSMLLSVPDETAVVTSEGKSPV